MESSRRKFLGLLGCAGMIIPTLPPQLGTNIAPLVPETAPVKEALAQLQIGFPRPKIDRWFFARKLAGGDTKIGMVDLGELMTAVDSTGDVYAAYTSYFECEGRYIFSSTDKALCETSKEDALQFRLREDFAAIEALGVEPDSVEFV